MCWNFMDSYIKPQIVFYDRFADLDNEKEAYLSYSRNKNGFNDIFLKDRVFVLAEPGYGKTRLLKEIVIRASIYQKEAIYIDLKKITKPVKVFVEENFEKYVNSNNLVSEDEIVDCQYIKTEKFALTNSEDVLICFDALDEIQLGEKFSDLIHGLQIFIKDYDKCNIFISCRTHHFRKYSNILNKFEFIFSKLFKFGFDQIQSFLEKDISDKIKTGQVIDNLSVSNRDTILAIPRYLYIFAKLIKERGVEEILKLNRTDLFELFIYEKLDKEEKKSGIPNKDIIKRVLEKLALIMEIYQTNILTKEELLTFFDNIRSNICNALVQTSSLQIFYDKSLVKDNIDHIQFENTEFQEYLAAKELSRIAKSEQALYDLAIETELKEVIPSWFNTLSFFIELDIHKLKQFLELGKHKPNSVQDKEYHKLLTQVKTERLDQETKKEIFDYVFNYYQHESMWIEYEIAEKLAFYYEPSSLQLILNNLDGRRSRGEILRIKRVNVLRIVMCLFKYQRLTTGERGSLKKRLVSLMKSCESSLQSDIIIALKYSKDFPLIISLLNHYDTDHESNLEHLILTLNDIQPNSEESLKYFIEGTKKKVISSRHGLYNVTGSNLIETIIEKLIEDDLFLNQFLYFESIFKEEEERRLITNIKKAINEALLCKIEDLIIKIYKNYDYYKACDSKYIRKLLAVLKENKTNALFSILKKIKENKILFKNSRFYTCLSIFINESNIEQFFKEIQKLEGGKEFALGLFFNMPCESQIYEKGRSYFPEEYEKYEKKCQEHQTQIGNAALDNEIKIYDKFKVKLGDKESGFYWDVFRYYINHAANLDNVISNENIERLKKLVFNILKNNPLDSQLNITNRNGGSTSYTMQEHIHVFNECLGIAKKNGWDLKNYQQNLINYIPFAYYQDLKLIFECVEDVNTLDINPLLAVYTKRQDDLGVFMPISFIEACDNYKLTSAVPILKEFILNQDLLLQDRRKALTTYVKLNPSQKDFTKIIRDLKEVELCEEVNEILIEKFNDKKAIEWRIDEIKKRAFKHERKFGTTEYVSKEVSELHRKEFADPLLNIENNKYVDDYYKLLEYSFGLIKKDNQYWEYVRYIWDIVCGYFYNLRIDKKYEYITVLEQYIYEKAGEKGANWFKYRLLKLKREYSANISKPDNILTCIQKYNKIVDNVYLKLKTDDDLIELVKNSINNDLKKFVEDEGYYRVIEKAVGSQEELIQKTLKTQLENVLLKKGLRGTDILREPQLADDKRIDFLISYGFLGPVLLEIKRTSNEEIHNQKKREAYKPKLKQYVSGFNSVFGYFLIFQTSEKYPLRDFITELEKLYKDCEIIEVLGLNCITSSN